MGLSPARLLMLLFVSAALFVVCFTSARQLPPSMFNDCIDGDFETNGTYHTNLNTLLSTLSSNTDIDYGFYNFSEGQGSDRVYAIALCQGDIDQNWCRECVNLSTIELPKLCPTQKEAIVWYDKCMLRYSNRSIFGQLESSPQHAVMAPHFASNASLFNQAVDKLLYELRDKASKGDSTRKFATGDTGYYELFSRIYALVQCTPDLTEEDCGTCLDGEFIGLDQYNGTRGFRSVRPSCLFRFEIHQFYETTPSSTPVAPPPAPSLVVPFKIARTRFTTIIIAVSTGLSGILFVCICIFLRIKRKNQKNEFANADEITNIQSLQFSFATIEAATKNFSDDNMLGQGGFGSVYKGVLSNGQEIAVKRLAAGSSQGDIEFKNEVVLMAKLHHRSLVRLLGFCLERSEKLLVYEFVPNASLDKFLFDDSKRALLQWESRYKIIAGVAKGLLYLHEDSRVRIIHRDLKISNILLDEDMMPKIGDFGIARLFMVDQTRGETSRVVGTYGYMPPEYVRHGRFSVKSDVYSFGVLVLELVSGQRNSSFQMQDTEYGLLTWVWGNWNSGTVMSTVDPSINSVNTSRDEMVKCIQIGLLCVQESESARPTMASVVTMLNSNSSSLPLPSKPSYFTQSSTADSEIHSLFHRGSGRHVPSDSRTPGQYDSMSELYPR